MFCPSWFETTGLSSLEAAAMGCNIVITRKEDAYEYFENDACYYDPESPESIFQAIDQAASHKITEGLSSKVSESVHMGNRGKKKQWKHISKFSVAVHNLFYCTFFNQNDPGTSSHIFPRTRSFSNTFPG